MDKDKFIEMANGLGFNLTKWQLDLLDKMDFMGKESQIATVSGQLPHNIGRTHSGHVIACVQLVERLRGLDRKNIVAAKINPRTAQTFRSAKSSLGHIERTPTGKTVICGVTFIECKNVRFYEIKEDNKNGI